MDKIIEVFSNADWLTILTFLGALWLYNKRIDRKFDKIEDQMGKLEQNLQSQMGKLEQNLQSQMGKLEQNLQSQMGKLEQNLQSQMGKLEQSLNAKIDKVDEKVTDIDRRLCRLEGAFSSKDCCMLKDDRIIKKAE